MPGSAEPRMASFRATTRVSCCVCTPFQPACFNLRLYTPLVQETQLRSEQTRAGPRLQHD